MLTIDLPKERIIEAAKSSHRPNPEYVHQYEPHLKDVLEERVYEVTGYRAVCCTHIFVIKDWSPECHFALGGGKQIPIKFKDQERYEVACDVFEAAVESKNYDAIEDFSIKIKYHPPVKDKVVQFEDGKYLKQFSRGQLIGVGWPHCPECRGKLGMLSREDQSRSSYWVCPTHGEVDHVVAEDGGKAGERRASPKIEHTDTFQKAGKMNSHLRNFIVEDLIDAGYKVK